MVARGYVTYEPGDDGTAGRHPHEPGGSPDPAGCRSKRVRRSAPDPLRASPPAPGSRGLRSRTPGIACACRPARLCALLTGRSLTAPTGGRHQ
jgi:hypothetical protein